MANENPYAAPVGDPNAIVRATLLGGEVWHAGKTLVLDRHARLPERCIKCNTPHCVTMVPRTLYYYPPWIAVFILCNLIVLLIVAVVARKKAVVELGICDECASRRRWAIFIAWTLVAAGFACLIGGAVVTDSLRAAGQGNIMGIAVLATILLIVAGAIVGVVRGQMVVVRLINERQIRLTGICRAYVAELPSGP